ncbi:MAG: hypothetical protein JW896_15545 [Deltaproteobacteria bacterium]|nr:hypothetical protein [Deltaproteobacteria bacterium]
MTTLSIHPIEYLRAHADYAPITRKVLRLVMLTGITLFLVGGLYNRLDHTTTRERDLVTQTYMNAFPSALPDVIIAPAGSFAHITF